MEEMKRDDEQLKKFEEELTKKTLRMFDDLQKVLETGVTTIANTKGISHEELEAVYGVGYTHYSAGRFETAEKVFHFLTVFSHTNAKYWTALGAAQQAQRQFEKALDTYAYAAFYDITKPKPFYFAAECALALGQYQGAIENCRSLLEYCVAGTAENDAYRAKATALIAKTEPLAKKAAEAEKAAEVEKSEKKA